MSYNFLRIKQHNSKWKVPLCSPGLITMESLSISSPIGGVPIEGSVFISIFLELYLQSIKSKKRWLKQEE